MPEVTDKYIRIPNPKFSGECNEVRTITLQSEGGIKALYCMPKKKVKTYLFDKDSWSMKDAKQWVKDHAKEAPQEMYKKATIDREEKGMVAIASEEVEDREGEVISIDGWDMKAYESNPVLLWMHNKTAERSLPIGRAKRIGIKQMGEQKRMLFEPEFETHTEFGKTIKKFYEDGLLNSFSVGFLPLEREGNKYTKQELLEISAVPVPALSTAMVISRAKDLGVSEEKTLEILGEEEKTTEEEVDTLKEQVKEILHAIRAVRREQKANKEVKNVNYNDTTLVDALKLVNQATGVALNRVKSQGKEETKS